MFRASYIGLKPQLRATFRHYNLNMTVSTKQCARKEKEQQDDQKILITACETMVCRNGVEGRR